MRIHKLRGKRGIMYSFLVIIMLLLMVIYFMTERQTSAKQKAHLTSKVINGFEEKRMLAEEDIERGIYIVSFRTFLSIDDIIQEEKEYIDDLPSTYEEIFTTGKYSGVEQYAMENSSFENFTKRFESALLEEGIVYNITVNDIMIEQNDPWHVTVNVNLTINMTDLTNVAEWNYAKIISSDILITSFNDPIYMVETDGLVMNQIWITNVTGFVEGNNVTNLTIHNNNSYYIASATAPSYLKRLTGDLSADPNGIESLVNIEDLIDQGITPKNRTIVDYLYFSDIPITDETNVFDPTDPDLPEWFWLDRDHFHTEVYGVEDLT